LPIDVNIEKWVSAVLEHQTEAIEKNKENMAKQKIVVEKPSTATYSKDPAVLELLEKPSTESYTTAELEEAFGPLGESCNDMFCCPKCNYKAADEVSMRIHLENELSKIR
jgi:hypothetical protein